MPGASAAQAKKNCFCNHCKNEFARRELDAHFLCVTCRAIPGVGGYRDVSKRGIDSGSPAYWEATKDQLNIVGADEDMARRPPTKTQERVPAPITKPRDERPQTEFQKWRLSVYASSLAADVKLCLLCLAEWGDYETGANIFPSEQAIAAALGLTRWQVRRLLRLGRDWAVPLRTKRQKGSRGDSVNLYQLRRPADAKYGPWNGPSRCDPKWIAVKGSPKTSE